MTRPPGHHYRITGRDHKGQPFIERVVAPNQLVAAGKVVRKRGATIPPFTIELLEPVDSWQFEVYSDGDARVVV